MTDSPRIEAYTDGACSGNPGPGGWGVLLRKGSYEKELCGGEAETTNQRMELTAAIEALKALKRPGLELTVYSDSQYVVKGMNEWMDGWKARGWKGSNKKLVANLELWQELDRLAALHQVSWEWVKGHSGHPGNERADGLAQQGITTAHKE